ncbi:MAG TPA: hypothetical protein VK162_04180, partial [Streptosporangiaceae bacterium]|nr:hypothetical protein [Streptosporangiaceae bacterium]
MATDHDDHDAHTDARDPSSDARDPASDADGPASDAPASHQPGHESANLRAEAEDHLRALAGPEARLRDD